MSNTTSPTRRGATPLPASVAYGLIFAVTFALGAWGYDGVVRSLSHGHWPAVALVSGAPFIVVVTIAAGYLLRRHDRARTWVWVWIVVGAVAGLLVSTAPYAGRTAATWLAEPGLRWIATNPFPLDHGARAVLYTVLMAGVGAVVGIVGFGAVGRSATAHSPDGRLTWRSWAHLLVCAPIALLPALAGDEMMNSGSRASLRTTARDLRGRLSEPYTVHLVQVSSRSGRAVVDVATESGVAMRCAVSDAGVANCALVSPDYRQWMHTIAEATTTGSRPSEALAGQAGLSVGAGALDAVPDTVERDVSYTIARDQQTGDWVTMLAHFDSSGVLKCHFRGHAPVVLNHCRFE